MKKKALYVFTIAGLTAALAAITLAHADNAMPPSTASVTAAQGTSDLTLAALLAALGQEFKQTTPANADQGKQSISLIFGTNPNMRLVGTFGPLNPKDKPQDSFEITALANAINGQSYTAVERVEGTWYYRRSTALSNFDTSCSLCHTNFGPQNSAEWVGALMLRVPITNGDN